MRFPYDGLAIVAAALVIYLVASMAMGTEGWARFATGFVYGVLINRCAAAFKRYVREERAKGHR